MSCDKSNCIISLGLTIMDRCHECDKIDQAAEDAERVDRVQETNKWKPPPPPMVSRDGGKTWKQVESTKDAEPQLPVPADGKLFFISCRERDGQQRESLVLGPYDTHEEALANVARGRTLAEENDPRAHWYSFGTCSVQGPTDRKGVFGK